MHRLITLMPFKYKYRFKEIKEMRSHFSKTYLPKLIELKNVRKIFSLGRHANAIHCMHDPFGVCVAYMFFLIHMFKVS